MKKFLLITLLLFVTISTRAQYAIKNPEGYSPQIGSLISMLDDLKNRVTAQVKNLSQEQTDFLMDEDANRFGALILHLAATEKYYQLATFHDKKFDEEKDKEWLMALQLGDDARDVFKGKPITYYLEKWEAVRNETKKVLKTKDDEWLSQLRDFGQNYEYNFYWAWFHVMEHQANHMGQIALMKKRMESQ